MEYLKIRDSLRNKKNNPIVRWVFVSFHYTILTTIKVVNAVSYYLLLPVSHSIDDMQTIHQDLTGESIGSNPSHSQLAKDHDVHPLHDIAAILAKDSVELVGKSLLKAYISNDVDDVINKAISRITHPKDAEWYKSILVDWAAKNQAKIERAQSRHTVEHYHSKVNGLLDKVSHSLEEWGVTDYWNKLFE